MENKLAEIELAHIPIEGLRAFFIDKQKRDTSMGNYQRLGFEVQSWMVKGWTGIYFGFSYGKNQELSLKQKQEFKKKEVTNGEKTPDY